MNVSINKGKDLTLNTVELLLEADPLSYVAFGAMEYQLYEYGTRNSLSKEEVSLLGYIKYIYIGSSLIILQKTFKNY